MHRTGQALGRFDNGTLPLEATWKEVDKATGTVFEATVMADRDECNRSEPTYESPAGLKALPSGGTTMAEG